MLNLHQRRCPTISDQFPHPSFSSSSSLSFRNPLRIDPVSSCGAHTVTTCLTNRWTAFCMSAMMSETADAANYHRQTCTECQRRKQKVGWQDLSICAPSGLTLNQCSREWPCNHCLKRKVPDQCTFSTFGNANDESPTATAAEGLPRRIESKPRLSPRTGDSTAPDLSALGYMTNELLNNLGLESKVCSLNVLLTPNQVD